MVSDSIFREGGAPRFLADRINHQAVIAGNKFIIPFNIIRLRVWDVSYIVFAKANRPEDTKPCAIIKSSAPAQPHWVIVMIPVVTRPIWLTEEYAIKAFRSVCRRHSRLAIHAPHRLRIIIGGAVFKVIFGKLQDKRNKPYLPNFSRMPANTIDPDTGASTCAFGSHKCTE